METTKLLLDNGADSFAKSRYGDDALQTACLRGAHNIFNHLKGRITYPTERLASANELIGELKVLLGRSRFISITIISLGSTYLDEHNETRLALLHWRLAHHIRLQESSYIGKKIVTPFIKKHSNVISFIYFSAKNPAVPLRLAYGNVTEFTTLAELDNISTDVDAMRIQSLLICERVLGIQHTDTLFRLMFR